MIWWLSWFIPSGNVSISHIDFSGFTNLLGLKKGIHDDGIWDLVKYIGFPDILIPLENRPFLNDSPSYKPSLSSGIFQPCLMTLKITSFEWKPNIHVPSPMTARVYVNLLEGM